MVALQLVTRVKQLCASNAKFKVAGSLLLVVGVPNAGKSTIINSFRELAYRGGGLGNSFQSLLGKGVKTGAQPGLTRQVSSILVSKTPYIYLVDTPGIMVPAIDDVEVGLRLCVTGTFAAGFGTVFEPATLLRCCYWLQAHSGSQQLARLLWRSTCCFGGIEKAGLDMCRFANARIGMLGMCRVFVTRLLLPCRNLIS